MSRQALWLACVVGCAPGPTIQLGSWPQEDGAGESDAGEGDTGASDAGESDAGESDAVESDAGVRDAQNREPIVPCSSELECAALEDQPHCSLAQRRCVECLVHAHCELGEFCDPNGSCEGH